MFVNTVSINFRQNQTSKNNDLNSLINQIGKNVKLPNETRNHAIFDEKLTNEIIKHNQKGLKAVEKFLKTANSEKEIAHGLYILDRMIEKDIKGVEKTYPTISRFNNTTSPTNQALLAGIYRKTQTPDAFGPLMKMMIRNSLLPQCPYCDPTEEIGGAILDYIRAKGAVHKYSECTLNK